MKIKSMSYSQLLNYQDYIRKEIEEHKKSLIAIQDISIKDGDTTLRLYDLYLFYCHRNNINPVAKFVFIKQLKELYDLDFIVTRTGNKTQRIIKFNGLKL